MLYQLVRPYLSMKDFHGQCGCKTEKKTLPISLVGFSKERIHVAMITKALPFPVLPPMQTYTQQAPEL